MFTGIIEKTAKLKQISPDSIIIENVFTDENLRQGDSIALNGTCLTVTNISSAELTFDILPETYQGTVFQYNRPGDLINLERALRADSRLDGHIVTGHVDGIAPVLSLVQRSGSYLLELTPPPQLQKMIAIKGSLAVNGISLTVQQVGKSITLGIIPTTYKMTNIQTLRPGSFVNLEIDILARYVARFFDKDTAITYDFLQQNGFA